MKTVRWMCVCVILWAMVLPSAVNAALPRYDLGDIPAQEVWHGSTCEFLVYWAADSTADFTFAADPQPVGDLKVKRWSSSDWHVSYTPPPPPDPEDPDPGDPEDTRPFTVTLTASSGARQASQSFEIAPMPNLPPEQKIFRTGEHTQSGPLDPQDISITIEKKKRYYTSPDKIFNYKDPEKDENGKVIIPEQVIVRHITLVGETIVFDHGKVVEHIPVGFNTVGVTDIEQMTVIAETVIVKGPLHLPQTNVTIYARDLKFKGADAQIITTPVDPPLTPANAIPNPIDDNTWKPCNTVGDVCNDINGKPKIPGKDGENGLDGLPAGNLELHIESFSTDGSVPVDGIRFDLRGGDGQAGGKGANGTRGTSHKVADWDEPFPSAYIFMKNIWGDEFNYQVKGGGWLITYQKHWEGVILSTYGTSKWPGDGSDARLSGWPGLGGDGGKMTSNYDVSLYVDNSGGRAGSTQGPYSGGAPGWPEKAVKVGSLGSYLTSYIYWEIEDHVALEGAEAAARPATRPGGGDPDGKDGTRNSVGSPYAWLHPLLLDRVLNHARDEYLKDDMEAAEARMQAYAAILDDYRGHASWNALDDMDKFALQQMYDEMQILLHRIASNLDYFGNPAGWTPRYSFELYHSVFQGEIKRAIKQLYLAYWIKDKIEKEQAKVYDFQQARDALTEEIEQAQTDYETAIGNMSGLWDSARDLDAQTRALQQELQRKEQELADQAASNVLTVWGAVTAARVGLKIGGTICSMIPVGQPVLGAVGSIATLASNIDPYTPWDSIIGGVTGGGEIATTHIKSQFDDASKKLKPTLENPNITPDDLKKVENLKTLQEGSAALSAGLKDMGGFLGGLKVPQDQIDAELERLKSQSPGLKAVVQDIEKLLADKKALAEDLARTMQNVARLPNVITQGILAIDAMNRSIQASEARIDGRVTMYLENMERRAFDRLLKYHYYLAKAYEYRLLEPYTEPLNLEGLIDKFKDYLNDNSETESTSIPNQFLSFKAVYEEILSKIALKIVDNAPGEKNSSRPFNLSAEEVEDLNMGKPVTINLMERGLFLSSRENVRIVNIEVDKLVTEYDSQAELYLRMDHSGLSKLVSDGKIYQFRHYTDRNEDPISWGVDYFPNSDNPIRTVRPSNAMESLLCSISGTLCEHEAAQIYLRPAAWADIVLTAENPVGNIVIKELGLNLIYDFMRQSGDTVNLQVMTSEEGLMPYFKVSKKDVQKRQDGRGRFLRIYDKSSYETISVEAPAVYGAWRFEKWTDKYGYDLGADPANPVLNVSLDSNHTVRAQMRQTKTIQVPGDYLTIQEALDAALPGDTVQVAAGTYDENITLKSEVDLLGAGAQTTVIDGSGSGPVVTASNIDERTRVVGFTITNGSSANGGGMSLENADLTIANCIFWDNAADYGAGLYADNSSPTLINCSFWGNTASADGGGMYNVSSSPTVSNTIFWEDAPNEIAGDPARVTYCTIQGGYAGYGNIDQDPHFVDPSNGNFHLLYDSPVINAGDNYAVPEWLTVDFEGDARIMYAAVNDIITVDMGVDEAAWQLVTEDGGTVSLSDESASVFFPPAAVPDEILVTIVQVDESEAPPSDGGFQLLGGDLFEVSAFDLAGNPVTDFGDKWVTLTLPYDEGSPTEILYYDDDAGQWVSLYPPLPPFDPEYSITDSTITGYTNHFTLFAVSGSDSGSDPGSDIIPEPGTFALIGLGLLGLLALARRKRKLRK